MGELIVFWSMDNFDECVDVEVVVLFFVIDIDGYLLFFLNFVKFF